MRRASCRPSAPCLGGLALGLAAAMLSAGCESGYAVRGRVVPGLYADAEFVAADDARLTPATGSVPHAKVTVYRDPTRPNIRAVATGRSAADGALSLQLDAFGAGWMEEQWLIEVVAPGHETLEKLVVLPASGQNRRLLITLRPGVSVPPAEPADPWADYERFR